MQGRQEPNKASDQDTGYEVDSAGEEEGEREKNLDKEHLLEPVVVLNEDRSAFG